MTRPFLRRTQQTETSANSRNSLLRNRSIGLGKNFALLPASLFAALALAVVSPLSLAAQEGLRSTLSTFHHLGSRRRSCHRRSRRR